VGWHIPIIPALERWRRQEDHEFQASHSKMCFKKQNEKHRKKEKKSYTGVVA
jgi:hypothetical protein